jgi:hypothetical protein
MIDHASPAQTLSEERNSRGYSEERNSRGYSEERNSRGYSNKKFSLFKESDFSFEAKVCKWQMRTWKEMTQLLRMITVYILDIMTKARSYDENDNAAGIHTYARAACHSDDFDSDYIRVDVHTRHMPYMYVCAHVSK